MFAFHSAEIHLKLNFVENFNFHYEFMTSFTHRFAGSQFSILVSINFCIFLYLSPIFLKFSATFLSDLTI